jgi:hypothetical protein
MDFSLLFIIFLPTNGGSSQWTRTHDLGMLVGAFNHCAAIIGLILKDFLAFLAFSVSQC